ncbi:MAG: nucleotidyltransferase domain-containing protein [Betaproteobacteria bacterium]|nr:MAG: nucleotidyltransferase domain-containing protein [Betaproteobacteria bacterium]
MTSRFQYKHPVSDEMRELIVSELRAIERRHDVTVLFACESGSRAWGFASPDSDYDVRFVYVNRLPWYLTVSPLRDVIEVPISGELDISGWDLRKALGLLQKSNPTLLEWLQSPIQYLHHKVAAGLVNLVPQVFSPLRGYHHYRSMAKTNFRGYLQGEIVRFKRYFYVLRPLLAARWIREGRGVPPMRFAELANGLIPEGPLADEINALLAIKMQANESATSARWPLIHDYIAAELDLPDDTNLSATRANTVAMNNYLHDTILKLNQPASANDVSVKL